MTTTTAAAVAATAGATAHRRGLLAGVAAYLIWGLFPLYFRQLGEIGSVELACARIVLTCAVTWIALAAVRDLGWVRTTLTDPKLVVRVVASGLLITANWFTYVWAVANDHVVDAAIGYFINPLMSVAFGVGLLGERLRPRQKVALGLGTVSVAVLTLGYGKFPYVALTLALSFALYGLVKKTTGLTGLRGLAAETLMVLPLGVVGLAVVARDGLNASTASTKTLILLAFVGVVTAVPLTFFGAAATRIPLAMIGLLQYIAPVFILITGVVFLGEKVPPERWIGIGFVVAALVVLASDVIRGIRPVRTSAVAAEI